MDNSVKLTLTAFIYSSENNEKFVINIEKKLPFIACETSTFEKSIELLYLQNNITQSHSPIYKGLKSYFY